VAKKRPRPKEYQYTINTDPMHKYAAFATPRTAVVEKAALFAKACGDERFALKKKNEFSRSILVRRTCIIPIRF
jgi:hypothetical protein